MTERLIANVPVPFCDSGKISAEGQEKYVRWMRKQGLSGVLIWSSVGHGDRIDSLEREEIYSTWRAGLTPSCAVLCAVPVGFNRETPLMEIRRQAEHATELGCDGIVLPESFQGLRLDFNGCPVFQVKEGLNGQLVSLSGIGEAEMTLSVVGACCGSRKDAVSSAIGEVVMDAPEEVLPQMILHVLSLQGVIGSADVFDPFARPMERELRVRLDKAWTLNS